MAKAECRERARRRMGEGDDSGAAHHRMRRREFIAGVGGAAAWPLVARAQQSAVPVVCYLQFGATRGDLTEGRAQAFLFGLSQAGFNNGINISDSVIVVP